jgi:hypothetical protein
MLTINPSLFAHQFLDELVKDFKIDLKHSCPKCLITYVDGYNEGCCFYSCEDSENSEDSDSEADCESESNKQMILNCIYDFECKESEVEKIMKEAIQMWSEKVLKECKRLDENEGSELFEKWKILLHFE